MLCAWLALAAMPLPAAGPGGQRAAGCPDLSGHYRVKGTGTSRALSEALDALHARMAAFKGSEVKLDGPVAGALRVWVKSGSSGQWPASPSAVLQQGTDFSCRSGWLQLSHGAQAERRIDEGWYEGRSTAALAPAPGGGLGVQVRFRGSQRTTIYSYDSARLSVPRLGTGRTLTESMRWPDITEPVPEPPAAAAPPAPEPAAVASVRRLLGHQVLGNVMLGPLQARGDAVLVTLTALRRDDVVRLEDRLRAAAIAYRPELQPVWSNNVYQLRLLVWPPGAPAAPAARPSHLRVEHEVQRLLPPRVDVQQVQALGEGYVVSLTLLDPTPVDTLVDRLKAHAPMFREVAVLGEAVRPDAPKVRTARLLLVLR